MAEEKPVNLKSPANPVGAGPSGVQINWESLPLEERQEQGRDVPLFVMEPENHTHQRFICMYCRNGEGRAHPITTNIARASFSLCLH